MSKLYRSIVLLMMIIMAASCSTPVLEQPAAPSHTQSNPPVTAQPTRQMMSQAQIIRYPAPDDYSYLNEYTKPPAYNPRSTDPFQIDLRSANLKHLDLSESNADLLYALFDSKTQWPAPDKMPADFDWQTIMETGKNPGLGVRSLHQEGITGKGVNIAIVDQPLIIDHIEYPDKIKLYEEINVVPGTPSQMHGPAVASIAVGKTVGVAPEANLYYIATWLFDPSAPGQNLTYRYYAQAVRRMIEINKQLPIDQKIRALSMSIGLNPANEGYDELVSAIEAAKEAGIFVMTVDLGQIYGWNILGLGRASFSDPDDFHSYGPASWWKQEFIEQGFSPDTLLVPMDTRTTASPTGREDYVFYAQGGMSWTVPYLAGMYALAVQVKPDIMPKEFWDAALKTGKTMPIQHDGKEYQFGVILDPQALIDEIRGN